jgi:predicted permease
MSRHVASDVRFAARSLLRTPRFALAFLLTTTALVASITAVFAFVEAVLLRALPYPHAERLVTVGSVQPNRFGTNVDYGDAVIFRRQARSIEQWALYRMGMIEVVNESTGGPMVQDLSGSVELLPLLGIRLQAGRFFDAADATAGAANVVIVSHELAQQLFQTADRAMGQTLTFRHGIYTIIGVSEPGADVPTNWLDRPRVWRPIRESTAERSPFTTIARLRDGVSLQQARADLTTLAAALAQERPGTHAGRTVTVTSLRDRLAGDYKPLLWIFFAAVTCVLAIGVSNLVTLQLARNNARARDLSVRAALGASRGRLFVHLAAEPMLLAAVGGAIGSWLASVIVPAVTAQLPPRFPRLDEIGFAWPATLFGIVMSLAIGLVAGGLPAWRVGRHELGGRLHVRGGAVTGSRADTSVQRRLLVLQTSTALVLLIGASLLGKSFYLQLSRDAGMQEAGLWTAFVQLPPRYSNEPEQQAFWGSALERMRALSEVRSAALAVNSPVPLSGADISQGGIRPEDMPVASGRGFSISTRRVSDQYFSTLQLPLLRGRPILASDVSGAERVAVVNELAAATLWPGRDPLGQRLRWSDDLITVVGLIPTLPHTQLDGELTPQLYESYRQRTLGGDSAVVMFRPALDAERGIAAIRSALTTIEPNLTLEFASMGDVRWRLLRPERFRTAVLVAFAASASGLALFGIVGLVSYGVGLRKREFAVRAALGADGRRILLEASHDVVRAAAVGLAMGIIGALLLTRFLATFLVGVAPTDVFTFAVCAGALALAAVAAAVLPGRRALDLDPAVALRAE